MQLSNYIGWSGMLGMSKALSVRIIDECGACRRQWIRSASSYSSSTLSLPQLFCLMFALPRQQWKLLFTVRCRMSPSLGLGQRNSASATAFSIKQSEGKRGAHIVVQCWSEFIAVFNINDAHNNRLTSQAQSSMRPWRWSSETMKVPLRLRLIDILAERQRRKIINDNVGCKCFRVDCIRS